MGMASYRIGPDALPHRIHEGAFGVFRDPTLLPVVFPGLVEELERRLLPMQQDERIIEVDFCSNASAIYHLEPIDYLVVRHWDQNGRLEKSTLILGRFSQGSFAQRATHVPILRQKQAQIMEQSRAMPMSNAFRQIRALFNRLPRRELFYAPVEELQPFLNRIIQITGDDEIAVHHRIGAGYVALYLAFSKQRYSYELEENLRRTLSRRFGPITFATSQDTESAQVVFFYFDLHRMDRALDEDEILKITERLLTTWPEAVSRRLTEALGSSASAGDVPPATDYGVRSLGSRALTFHFSGSTARVTRIQWAGFLFWPATKQRGCHPERSLWGSHQKLPICSPRGSWVALLRASIRTCAFRRALAIGRMITPWSPWLVAVKTSPET